MIYNADHFQPLMNANEDPTLSLEEIDLLKSFFGEGARYVSGAGIQVLLETLERGPALSEQGKKVAERLKKILAKTRIGVASGLIGSVELEFKSIIENLTVEEISGHMSGVGHAEFFKSGWSKKFVHGPDTMIPVTLLAEKILKPGEKLARIERISWRKPITNNAKLYLLEGKPEQVMEEGSDLFDGTLITTTGRTLHFAAKEKEDSPVTQNAVSNPLAQSAFCDCEDCYKRYGDVHIFGLKKLENIQISSDGFYPFFPSTLCEIITLALHSVCEKDQSLGKEISLKLLGGINNLELPETDEQLFPEGGELVIFMKPGAAKKGKSGFTIVPFEFKFPHQKGTGSGIMAMSKSDDLTDEYLDRCRNS